MSEDALSRVSLRLLSAVVVDVCIQMRTLDGCGCQSMVYHHHHRYSSGLCSHRRWMGVGVLCSLGGSKCGVRTPGRTPWPTTGLSVPFPTVFVLDRSSTWSDYVAPVQRRRPRGHRHCRRRLQNTTHQDSAVAGRLVEGCHSRQRPPIAAGKSNLNRLWTISRRLSRLDVDVETLCLSRRVGEPPSLHYSTTPPPPHGVGQC